MKRSLLSKGVVPSALVLSLALAACGGDDDDTDTDTDAADEETAADAADDADADDAGGDLSGSIEVDGSSTVGPLTDAISEEYNAVQPDVTVNLGISGTGGGFERFCETGDTQISNASRPIEDDEVALCEENGVEYTEVQVGVDALTMVVNEANDFAQCLTTEELITLWGPDGAATWDEVNPDFPAEPIEIFAPDADSGTYDFFNETVLEPNEIEEPRQDYNASADDNIIAQGILGTTNAWGYFGFAYFQENPDGLTAVEFDGGEGCVAPSEETALDESYQLTRPLFIYIRNDALAEPHIADFATFYLETVNSVIGDVGYIAEPDEELTAAQDTLATAIEAAQG